MMDIGKTSQRFTEADTSDFPDFDNYEKPLERGLWILWVAKDKLGIKKMTAQEIASIIRDVKEISVDPKSITNSFNRAGDKIHPYQEDGKVSYEIMKPGKGHLSSLVKEGSIEVFYFEPDKRYTSKAILAKNILTVLGGELRIVDPYCGERTLDVLGSLENTDVKFLTRIDNLPQKKRQSLLRELEDFKSEHPKVEFRDYPRTDIHDRYIISDEQLVLLGHSIKDLGGKESFAVLLDRKYSEDVVKVLRESFDKRWSQSQPL